MKQPTTPPIQQTQSQPSVGADDIFMSNLPDGFDFGQFEQDLREAEPSYGETFDQIRAEADTGSPEDAKAAEQLIAIYLAELAMEIKWAEETQERANFYLEGTRRALNDDGSVADKSQESEPRESLTTRILPDKYTADTAQLGWLADSRSAETPQDVIEVQTGDKRYRYVDLTPLNGKTDKGVKKLKEQKIHTKEGSEEPTTVYDEVMDKLRREILPQLLDNIKHSGIGLRAMTYHSPRDRLNSRITGYKFGIQGPKNRAVVVVLDNDEANPLYGIVALYDHDDDQPILRALAP